MIKLLLVLVVGFFQSSVFASNSIEARNTGGFVTGTKVLAANEWELYEIDDLCTGSELASLDESNFTPTSEKIVDKFYHEVESVFSIGFKETSETNTLAFDQIVLVKQDDFGTHKWIKAKDLNIGDEILSFGGRHLTVSDLKENASGEDFYDVWNIELSSTHTFYVGEENKILVHNAAFVIPIATWVIGEGVIVAAGSTVLAAIATALTIDTYQNMNSIGDSNSKTSKRHTPDQQAVTDLAKEAKQKKGSVTTKEAETLVEWGKESGLGNRARGPESHPTRKFGKEEHIHVGPVNHLPVKD